MMKIYFTLTVTVVFLFSSCTKEGCTNYIAENFDKKARIDDGSCIIHGCTDPNSINYNANATISDGSCTVFGCTDPLSSNYNPSANTDDGSCVFPGSITFWSKSDYSSNLLIYLDGEQVGILSPTSTSSSNWISGNPTCGQTTNCLTIDLPPGQYKYSSGIQEPSVEFFVVVNSENCELIRLF